MKRIFGPGPNNELLGGLLSIPAPVGMYSIKIDDFVRAHDGNFGFVRRILDNGMVLFEYPSLNISEWRPINELEKIDL